MSSSSFVKTKDRNETKQNKVNKHTNKKIEKPGDYKVTALYKLLLADICKIVLWRIVDDYQQSIEGKAVGGHYATLLEKYSLHECFQWSFLDFLVK